MKPVLMRVSFAAVSIIMLTGLKYPTALPQPTSTPPRVYTLVDQRDPKSLKSGFESLMITNCAYGITRIGENDIDPDLPLLLDAMLSQRFGDRLMGRTIKLNAFKLHLNNALGLREHVSAMYTGLIPSLMNKKKVGCKPEDLFGGYTVGEVQPGIAPLIVAIELEVDGRRIYARAIDESEPFPPTKRADQAAKDRWNAKVAEVVESALVKLGDQVDMTLFTAPVAPVEAAVTGAPAGAADQ